MDLFLLSTVSVAIAEIGDKTQLLAIVLACRYRQPWTVLAGILVATLANHALAAMVGAALGEVWDGPVFGVLVGVLFLAVAAWALVPDRLDDAPQPVGRASAFLATVLAFFVVEMGDKTQIATVLLAAGHGSVIIVAAGTTLGMMLANAPAVFLGEAAARVLPLAWMRRAAAVVFAGVGVWTILAALGMVG